MTELASIRFVNEGDIVIAMVTGEIDLSNASRLLMTVTDAVANEATGLIMDLSDVAFMDSTGGPDASGTREAARVARSDDATGGTG